MGQPSRTGRPVSPKPVMGDLDVCVLDEAKPLLSSSSSSSRHRKPSRSPHCRSIKNNNALSSKSRTRDEPRMRVFQLMNNLRPGFLPTTNTAGLLGTETVVESVTGSCFSFRSTQGRPPSSDDFESDCPEHFFVRRPDRCCPMMVAKSCIASVARRLPEFIVFGDPPRRRDTEGLGPMLMANDGGAAEYSNFSLSVLPRVVVFVAGGPPRSRHTEGLVHEGLVLSSEPSY
ncbi:hypothetical protein MRX96_011894 [Rhipicephalus microplus]